MFFFLIGLQIMSANHCQYLSSRGHNDNLLTFCVYLGYFHADVKSFKIRECKMYFVIRLHTTNVNINSTEFILFKVLCFSFI